MTVIQSVTGSFSDNFTIQFVQHTGTQGLVQITDSASAATAVTIPVVHGGSIGVANTNLSPARVAITDARIDIPRGNGTLII